MSDFTPSYTVYLGILGAVVTRETDKAKIDDFPFRLQYKVATAIAFLSCVLYSAAELVGKYDSYSIKIIIDGKIILINANIFNLVCFYSFTFWM